MFAATGSASRSRVGTPPTDGRRRNRHRGRGDPRWRARSIGRSPASATEPRPAIMLVLGALVSSSGAQFLTARNISQVAVLASIIAVAAVGEALVVITRNVDLSVEAIIGLVAYCRRRVLEQHDARSRPRWPVGIGLGLLLGHDQRRHRHGPAGPGDRGHAGHAEHLPGPRLPHRGQPPGPAGRNCRPASPTPPTTTSSGIPIFVIIAIFVVVVSRDRPAPDPIWPPALRRR